MSSIKNTAHSEGISLCSAPWYRYWVRFTQELMHMFVMPMPSTLIAVVFERPLLAC
jgi:hypothetical protein